jgi:S1-C subfamily serine protease
VGAIVLALGRPWDGGVTASLGVISALGGEWRTWHGGRIDRLVRLDITVHDGFSGGPLVTADGLVVGIDTSALRRGAAVTIPSSTVERVADELLTRGRIRRGYLGIAMQPVRLSPAMRSAAAADSGLLVLHVDPDGPADAAGVLLGDILLGLGDRNFRDLREVAAALGPETIATTVQARLLRAGQPTTVDIRIGERAGEDD